MLETAIKGSTMILTLTRPGAVNALNEEMYEALHAGLQKAREDNDVRSLVIAGAGQKAFCAGADMKEYADLDPQLAEQRQLLFLLRMLVDFVEFPKPIVAAVHAPAIGAGMMLACACDEIVMSDATWMSLPEAKIDIPAPIAAVIVGRRTHLGAMQTLLQRAERMPAQECLRHGIVDELVPAEQVLEKACERMTIYDSIKTSVYTINKRWLNRGLRAQLEQAARSVHL